MRRFGSGRFASTRCRNSAVSSSSRSGERASLTMIVSASRRSSRLLACGSAPAGVDDDRAASTPRSRSGSCSMQLEAGHVGQAEVEHHAVELRSSQSAGAPPRRCRPPTVSTSPSPISSTMRLALRLVVLDDAAGACSARSTKPLMLAERLASASSRSTGLLQEARGAQLAGRAAARRRTEMTWTGMWRVRGSCFSRSSTRPAVHVGQAGGRA